MTNRFTIRNASKGPLILNAEPEAIEFSLPAGETVVVTEVYEKEPLELTFESHEGENIIAIWPSDGNFRVEKEGKYILGLL